MPNKKRRTLKFMIAALALMACVGCGTTQARGGFSMIGTWTIDRELAMSRILSAENIDYGTLTAEEKTRHRAVLDREIIRYEHSFHPDSTYSLVIETARNGRDVFEGSYRMEKTGEAYLMAYDIVKNGRQVERSHCTIIVHDYNSIEMRKEDGTVLYYERLK